jgi:hypothetical protein
MGSAQHFWRRRFGEACSHLALDLGGHLAVLHVLDHPAHPLLEAKVRALHLHGRSGKAITKGRVGYCDSEGNERGIDADTQVDMDVEKEGTSVGWEAKL